MTAHVMPKLSVDIIGPIRRTFGTIFRFLDKLGRARGAAKVSETLYAMDEQGLAQLGLTREDIPKVIQSILHDE